MVTHRISGFRTLTGAALIAAGLGAPVLAQPGPGAPPQGPPPAQGQLPPPAEAPPLPPGPITLEQALAIAEGRSETIAGA